MDDDLILYLEGVPHLHIRREGGIPGQLRSLFARLDADMDDGIELDGQMIAAPDPSQRMRFVLGQLLAAVAAGKADFARTLLVYMASHEPDLQAIWVVGDAADWSVDLDFR